MSELARNRINFIELLHERFLMKKGHGAFAYISVPSAITLFEDYLDSGEPADLFINRFVLSM